MKNEILNWLIENNGQFERRLVLVIPDVADFCFSLDRFELHDPHEEGFSWYYGNSLNSLQYAAIKSWSIGDEELTITL